VLLLDRRLVGKSMDAALRRNLSPPSREIVKQTTLLRSPSVENRSQTPRFSSPAPKLST
jgi:hypothetical protein